MLRTRKDTAITMDNLLFLCYCRRVKFIYEYLQKTVLKSWTEPD